jgi:monovalent cation/hydrogen antiporter
MILAHTGRPLSPGWRVVLIWAGLRGAVSFAAALSLPPSLHGRDLLLTLTFGIVLFTILVQGGTLHLLLERLAADTEERPRCGPAGTADAGRTTQTSETQ